MQAQTSTQKSAAFDQIYEKVPTEQVARLKEFRHTHPYKQLIVGDTKWEYISCGQGEQTLLLLPERYPLASQHSRSSRLLKTNIASSRLLMRCHSL